ncbi:MAG: alpha/beta fold hydrolase [Chloroflexota bacterium]
MTHLGAGLNHLDMEYGVREPDHLGAVRLADGRRLGWAQWGPADGTPVLFFGGAATSRSLGFGADALDRLGVRLLAVDRPGLGASDPDPARTLSTWPQDIAQLVADLELAETRIVGFSQGAPFALACAAAGIVQAVAIVSGQDDLTQPSFTDHLDPHLGGLLQAIAADPTGVEATFVSTANAEMLWQLITAYSSGIDLAVYTSDNFQPAFRRALAEGFAQGAAGYVRDLVLTMQPWPFTVEEIAVPVDLWYGAHDASTVHSPDFGETLARRLPNARRWLLPDAGGSLLWTHAEEILTSLLAR